MDNYSNGSLQLELSVLQSETWAFTAACVMHTAKLYDAKGERLKWNR